MLSYETTTSAHGGQTPLTAAENLTERAIAVAVAATLAYGGTPLSAVRRVLYGMDCGGWWLALHEAEYLCQTCPGFGARVLEEVTAP